MRRNTLKATSLVRVHINFLTVTKLKKLYDVIVSLTIKKELTLRKFSILKPLSLKFNRTNGNQQIKGFQQRCF